MMFGEHAGFIIPSYIITFVTIFAMTLFIVAQYKARKAELKRLEDAGVRRRADNDR